MSAGRNLTPVSAGRDPMPVSARRDARPASALLDIRGLDVALPPGGDRPLAVRNVDLDVARGEIVCVVGESGSGKSMLANAVMRLLPEGVAITRGSVRLEGDDLASLDADAMRAVRGPRAAMIFQEPMTALNPLLRVGDQVAEPFRVHNALPRGEVGPRVEALLAEVGIPDPKAAARAYPHQLSGGQRQRAMIAMSLALEPALLIADEPTTALDVTTQARVLKLIREVQSRKGMGVLFITHDFGVVAEIGDRVAVMRAGEIVETGPAREVLARPQHPYTRALVAAVPSLAPPPPRRVGAEPILVARDLAKTFRTRSAFGRVQREVRAVRGVSFELPRGATLGIVGESGSGKSTLARLVAGLVRPDHGSALVEGVDLARLKGSERRAQAFRAQMVFQDPFASLNPRRRVGDIVADGPRLRGVARTDALAKARELFELVGLPPDALGRFPHEFSGGQRQRIGIARALAVEPSLLIADEPVSALDVSVQAQVLKLLASLRERLNLSMLFITHDLRVAAQVCDRVAVMKDGEIVEEGAAAELFAGPSHPYTRALLDAVPGRDAFGAPRGAGEGDAPGATAEAVEPSPGVARSDAPASSRLTAAAS